ncbi:DUF3883 domain-containing protein [Pseudomonas syringae]|uniref:DUF3883 domain-containing protein n=1 Tax=Pseudomonas syringae TaxID=317 RepID=UPI001BCC56FC|nr:DUF3883 domain-containing protein [Pseudomonas syringae]MBS7426184.1 DUF3883 domain-containing protein [Pseudomonas syringae]MBS7432233.1 DUF3883 domain-containing protein [Pseudomonas syringae]QVI82645.1 DUF3883 domain-containing protein [Pseudomonas syringae]
MTLNPLSAKKLNAFEKTYDASREAKAEQSRGEFLEAFPLTQLPRLKLKDYVIGLQSPTFCDHVEVKTRPWAVIQGSTAIKFGIYFGSTKTDATKEYRYSKKFGDDETGAFRAVRSALTDLIKLAVAVDLDFKSIDANPLSQMFKAKILSLYFPDRFINACSGEHLEMLGDALGFSPELPISQYQHLIVKAKHQNPLTSEWSNPKFTAFLYRTIVRADVEHEQSIQKPTNKKHRKVNFEDIQEERNRIGKAAEEYARKWEEQRLVGASLPNLVSLIEDRRDYPSYGYDFMSHTAEGKPRYIEVKSVGKARGESYRFFLSDNELATSKSLEHEDEYYFYLVFFDGKGTPRELKSVLAKNMYQEAEVTPASYTVRFDLKQ